jgi:hypothetical protein
VNTGSGSGTIRLDVVDNDTIRDSGNTPLGGSGAGNGGFTAGQVYTIDRTPPNDPTNVHSTDHTTGNGSTDNTITVAWTPATDNPGGSGVDGYAYVFNTTAPSVCDQGKDLEETATSVTSGPLSPGVTYYFHICTRDNVGNWTSTVNLGPFPIQAPSATATPTRTPTRTPTATPTRTPTPAPVANTGFKGCSWSVAVTTSGDKNGFQSSPINACNDGSGYASDDNSGTNTSQSCADVGKDRQVFTGYNLPVPSSASVKGIEVRIDGWADSTSGGATYCVQLWNGSTWVGMKTVALTTDNDDVYVLGSPTDKWGFANWTPAMISNLHVLITSVSSNGSRDFRLDWVAVKVTYSP